MIGDHQEGFGFIANTAIDQHFFERNRQNDMFEVIKCYPHLLGIGIGEDTSIVVQGSIMTVHGSGCVAAYDGKTISVEKEHSYDLHSDFRGFRLLRDGDRYDIKARILI
jgi:cyanophycinase